jgi:phage terminase large subunit-like protein
MLGRAGLGEHSRFHGIGAGLSRYGEAVFDVLCRFWLPEEAALIRERRGHVPQWIRDGRIIGVEGRTMDYRIIRSEINDLYKRYRIHEIAFDKWNSSQLVTELQGDGLTMVDFGQGFSSMAAPVRELLALIADGRLRHGNHPVLRWMASNAAGQEDPAGNIKFDKGKSSEKIDGLVALAMAIGRAVVSTPREKKYQAFFVGGEPEHTTRPFNNFGRRSSF